MKYFFRNDYDQVLNSTQRNRKILTVLWNFKLSCVPLKELMQ